MKRASENRLVCGFMALACAFLMPPVVNLSAQWTAKPPPANGAALVLTATPAYGEEILHADDGARALSESRREPCTINDGPERSLDGDATSRGAGAAAITSASFDSPMGRVEISPEHCYWKPVLRGADFESLTDTAAGDSRESNPADANSSNSKEFAPAPVRPAASLSHGPIAWGPLLREALLFATIEDVHRVCCEVDTIPELKGVLLSDYFKSIASIHGWDDWDPIRVQYIGHSFQGAVAARLEIQNDPLGQRREIGTPGYWKSALRAFVFAAAYGTQFKIGPYSEAMIGNVGLPNEYRKRPLPQGADYGRMAWSEFFIDPIGGTLWVTTEDLLDRHVIKKEEQAQTNYVLLDLSRTFLLPSRSFANILRFKRPWYEEGRPVRLATAAQAIPAATAQDPPVPGLRDYARFNLFTGYSYLHAGGDQNAVSLGGWEGSATWNLSPWFGLEANVDSLHGSDSGSIPRYVPRYTFLIGPRVTFKEIAKINPFVHWLWGGARGTAHTYASGCAEASACAVSSSTDTFFAGDVGGGFDIKLSPRFSVRALEADYLYDNFQSGQAHAQFSAGIVLNLRWHGR